MRTCKEQQYRLCDCIDSIPANTTDFLWDKNSPLYTRYNSWKDAGDEFGEIIRHSFFSPKYFFRHIKSFSVSTIQQLIAFDAGDGNGSFAEGTKLYERIQRIFEREAESYISSRQNRAMLESQHLQTLNLVYRIVILLSFIGLCLSFVIGRFRKQIPMKVRIIVYSLLFAVFLNALINASLVIVTDRFGAKVIWFILLAFLLVLTESRFFGLQKK